MVFAFFALWALGAALLVSCSALMWSERISVLRTVPTCDECGYDLTGLGPAAKCPECAGIYRKFASAVRRPQRAHECLWLWGTPLILGLLVAGGMGILTRVPSPDNVIGTFTNMLPFLGAGLLLRIMLRWITLGAAKAMMWCSVGVLAISLVGIMLEASREHGFATTAKETFRIAPLMTAPYAGFGLAMGIGLLSFARARPARPNRARPWADRVRPSAGRSRRT